MESIQGTIGSRGGDDDGRYGPGKEKRQASTFHEKVGMPHRTASADSNYRLPPGLSIYAPSTMPIRLKTEVLKNKKTKFAEAQPRSSTDRLRCDGLCED